MSYEVTRPGWPGDESHITMSCDECKVAKKYTIILSDAVSKRLAGLVFDHLHQKLDVAGWGMEPRSFSRNAKVYCPACKRAHDAAEATAILEAM